MSARCTRRKGMMQSQPAGRRWIKRSASCRRNIWPRHRICRCGRMRFLMRLRSIRGIKGFPLRKQSKSRSRGRRRKRRRNEKRDSDLNLSVRANEIFDEITQHSRNQRISVEKAVKESIERAKKEKEKK